jgi:hypothetical protein
MNNTYIPLNLAKELLDRLDRYETKLNVMAKQIDTIYHDDYEQSSNVQDIPDEELPMEEKIKRLGQKIPYNLISDPIEVMRFKDFLYEAKKKGSQLSQIERDLLDIADKNFNDIRLSSKHLSVLKSIYQRLYGKQWPFKYQQGYMYKLEGYQPEWEFFEDQRS